jgi:predicted aspartyl protease
MTPGIKRGGGLAAHSDLQMGPLGRSGLVLLLSSMITACGAAGTQSTPASAQSTPAGVQGTPAAATKQPVTVPFTVERGRIHVPAFVNGHGPFHFMVDTGASGAGRVDVRLVEQLGLRVTGTTTNSDLVSTATITTVQLESLRIGALEQRDVEVLSRDYNVGVSADAQRLMGIIGRDFFPPGMLMTIDYGRRELTTSAGSLSESDPHVTRYDQPFVVPMKLGEHETVGHVDTGSNTQMHLPMEWARRLGIQSLQPAGEGRRANTVFKLFSAELPVPARIAGNSLAGIDALFSEQARQINIGAALFARQECVLDFDRAKQLVRMRCRP